MKSYRFISNEEADTKSFAAQLAVFLHVGDLITLSGDLGVGKTTFTKGLAQGLQIKRPVTSPTFTIIKEYSGEKKLYHMDAYRLEHSEEDIGFDEYFYGDGISVVEWAEFIEEYLPQERLEISLQYKDELTREIILTAIGARYETLLDEIAEVRGD